jgi:ubiquinone/menaquinone biosynthesis C-methylase UbiE
MTEKIETQYDGFVAEFVDGAERHNLISRTAYYKVLDFDMKDKMLLDVGCGDGFDILKFKRRGANVYGIDASTMMVDLARRNVSGVEINAGLMEEIPYPDSFFDMVLSKYVLQTSRDVPRVLGEMERVLKPGGLLVYLSVHPIRQFLEKKKHPKDYFLQEEIESVFFGGTVTAEEPTHTISEYLNSQFFERYDLLHFNEHADFPSSERIDGDTYPCFFVVKARKRFRNSNVLRIGIQRVVCY